MHFLHHDARRVSHLATLALLFAVWIALPATASAEDYQDWKHSGSIWLNTTADGAQLAEGVTVEQFPVLLRLHRDFFDFAQAQPDGADLRVLSSSGEPLALQIDEWDAARGQASVWVRVPRINGNARQELRLLWGNTRATTASNGAAVFNRSNGYLGVWHLQDPLQDEAHDEVGEDTGTTATEGLIGQARHFATGHGIAGGEDLTHLPEGAASHSTELWFRPAKTNATLIAWGNEEAQGKVVMQFRSPPHITMDCYFSGGNVEGTQRIPLGEWTHVVHTYREGEARLYVNGVLDAANVSNGGPLNLKRPARRYLGGWYGNYDFAGDLDEVRISDVVRTPEWIRLQHANQRQHQLLTGPIVQPGDDFSVSADQLNVDEGQQVTIKAQAGGAQKLLWYVERDGQETLAAIDRLAYTFEAGRVAGKSQTARLTLKAIYPTEVKTRSIAITIRDVVPEPAVTLEAPTQWDGRQTIEVMPRISNLAAMRDQGAGDVRVRWTVEDVAVVKRIEADRLVLKRAQGNGRLRITASIDNGGAPTEQAVTIDVTQPPPSQDAWIPRPLADREQPEDNQFIARQRGGRGGQHGSLVYAGTLDNQTPEAETVFLRVFADDQLLVTETAPLAADRRYSLTAKLPAGLVKYRTEFGTKRGDQETVLHTARNIVCGDAYLIQGQSNAVATDFGPDEPPAGGDWVRTFGATSGDPRDETSPRWVNAIARGPEGRGEIGYWGMELGRRLVASENVPICILNGAVGGTRIDQHQRVEDNPTAIDSLYGRLLYRVQQAKLTHGIRAILWHQGENDQGADGPTGGYGYETYRSLFVDLAASWKEDYPNVEHYYVFQIWPKACAMGIEGSDNRLREVQRTLPRLFSNLSVLSTLGIKPPGGCHYPAAGYAEFARMLEPMMKYHLYHRYVDSFDPPNLQRAYFTSPQRDEVVLEFSQHVTWSDALVREFHLEGEPGQVAAGAANGQRITLKLKAPTQSRHITYLDGDNWSPDNLLYGQNGLAALTFCEVPIEHP